MRPSIAASGVLVTAGGRTGNGKRDLPASGQSTEAGGAAAIRVLIVDDYPLEREGLRAMLGGDLELVVVGAAPSGVDAKRLVAEREPAVVIVNLGMRGEDSLAIVRWVKQHHPSVKVVVLSDYDEESMIVDAIAAGASGYLLKDCSSSLLCHTVHTVVGGAVSFAEQLLRKVTRQVTQADREAALHVAELTNRQREVLRLIALGKSNRDIAASLFLSESTVKKYIHTLLSKLDAGNRTQAAIKAVESGMLSR